MTQIQASVIVKDSVDNKIEQKIKAIGIASEQTANKLKLLQQATRGISSANITGFNTALGQIARTNLNGLATQIQQVAQSSSQLGNSFSNTSIQAVKLQTAQVKLQQEQVKLQILQQRLATNSTNLATAQQRLATATSNAQNATTRASTAHIRNTQAQTQNQLATIRLQLAQLRLAKAMQSTSTATHTANTSVLSFAGSMAMVAGIASSAMGLALLGDEYQRLTNRLVVVTGDAEKARDRLASMADIAQRSYTSVGSVTQLYTRLHLALRQTGGSASEAMQMTQTLSKAVSLAGLTTAEANSALLQISQAFNKGKLDGDEFRTVMETMPPLADALAKKLGVTRGELLKLAPEGKITGQVMKEAVMEMTSTIDSQFSKITPTIAMQLQNLQTQAQMYFGAMFKDTGSANAISMAIGILANNLDTATKMAGYLAVALALASARSGVMYMITQYNNLTTAVGGAVGMVNKLKVAFATTPVGLIVTGVMALGLALDAVFDNAISKTIFPHYDQDQAKARDYISRLRDIASQLNVMSYDRLKQESVLLDQAMLQNKKTIADLEKKVFSAEKAISRKEKALADAQKELERYNNGTLTAIDMNGAWGLSIDNTALAQERVTKLTEELADEKANLVNSERDLAQANEDSTELMKVQLRSLEEQISKIDSARNAIADKTEEDIKASQQLQDQKKIVDSSKGSYDSLKVSVDNLRSALVALGATDLTPAMNEAVVKAEDKVHQEKVKKIREAIEWQKRYAQASKDDRMVMDAEKKFSNEKEHFRQSDGSLSKEWDEIIRLQVEADKMTEARRKADSEAQKKATEQENKKQQAIEKAKREAEKQRKEQEKAKLEHKEYLSNLQEEHNLLQIGLKEHNKYQDIYKLRNKLQKKGYEISEEEIDVLKQQIDANEKLKELAKETNSYEEQSLAKQRESALLKIEALNRANISDTDKQIATDNIMSSMGATGSTDQGITQLLEKKRLYYEQLDLMREQDRISETEYQNAIYTINSQTQDAIYQQRLENMHNLGGMWEVTATAFESFEQNATNSIMSVLNGTKSISEAMRDLARTMLTSVVQAIVQMGVKWIAQQLMQQAFGQSMMATQLATSTAMATSMATAWATPASLVSLASYGANAVPAQAGIAGTLTMAKTLAIAGARRNGGSVNAGSLYQVGEGNAPEIYQSKSGRQYMIAGDNGRVFSNKQVMGGGSKVVNVTQNVTINGDGKMDADTLNQMREQTRAMIYEVLVDEQRDAGGMLA